MDDTMEEEEMFASPNTVCTGCPVLEKKIVFYQKQISWPRTGVSKLFATGARFSIVKVVGANLFLHIATII